MSLRSVERRPIGSDYVSAVGLGTWDIRDYSRAFDAFVKAASLGINLVDTAEIYDGGRAEEFVGRVISAVGRDELFVTTKIWPDKLVDRDAVLRAARASLRRLGIGYADLILIHWPNEALSTEAQVRNFEAVYEEGLARYIGVSNFDLARLEEAVHATRRADIVVDQVHYSARNRRLVEEQGLLEFCSRNRITIQAYRPLEKGSLASNELLARVGAKYGRTAAQAAINYVIRHERVVALVKTEKVERIEELVGAMGWRLSEEDVEYIRRNL
ncbi:MAG: aldo/keto reductase [Desulfurococcaceae archaeon]